MRKTSLFTRSLAALLCFVMVLGMLPVFGMAPTAYADEVTGDTTEGGTGDGTTGSENQGQQTNITGDYITLPITIRDYAADGMLFEYNEVNRYNLDDGPDTYTKTDRLFSYTGSPYPCYYNVNTMGSTEALSQGIFVMSYATNGTSLPTGFTGEYWYCLIVGQNGDILKVMRSGESKATYAADMDADYTVNGTTVKPYYSVWAWRDAKNLPYYNLLAQVTEQNKDQYRVAVSSTTTGSTTTYQIYLGHRYYSNVNPTNISTVETDKHKGIYVIDGDQIASVLGSVEAFEKHTWWHCLVVDVYNGRNWVVKAIPNGVDKTGLTDYMDDTYKFVLVWSDGTNRAAYDTIAAITADNLDEYDIVTVSGTVFGSALFVERTISVNEADTRGFGLLMTGDYDYLDNLSATSGITSSQLVSNNYANNGTITTKLWDEGGNEENYYATQYVHGATIRTNLVAMELDEITKKPRYTEDTVTYLATYMQALMAVPEKDASGNYNTHHVEGAKLYGENKEYVGPGSPLAVYDLADIFRMNVTGGLGDYTPAKTKFDNRQLLYPHQATTWYEAAYYLLHMLWNDSPVDDRTGTEGQDGYGMPIERYNRIHLVKTTNENGDECYVFNAKYDGTTYDYWNGEIFNSPFGEYNTETRPYSSAYEKDGDTLLVSGGNILPAARFDPLGPSSTGFDQGYKMVGSPDTYGDFSQNNKMNWAEYYDETNYHMSLEGHAQFVYHEDSNQYFTFTGDDDVYLYINGVRVLDVGGAHSIAKVSIDLNDVAADIGLSDGGTYRFDFFFLERHGTAANFGIETNIQIADASMNTAKTGYQGGTNTGYGGPVNAETHVGYSFELHNQGTAHIYNLTFQDDQIGVYFGYDRLQYYPTTYPEDYPEDKKGAKLYTINDLYLIYWNSAGVMTEFVTPGSLTEKSLKDHLKAGLEPGEKIGIYGFKYFIPDSQWVTAYELNADGTYKTDAAGKKIVKEVYFNNHVYTSANTDPNGQGTPLHGVSDWKVVQMEVPYEPFHVYDWVHKDVPNALETEVDTPWVGQSVTVDWTKLKEYLKDEDLTDDDLKDAYVVRCTGSGNELEHNQNPCVEVSGDGRSITYTSSTTGKDTVFFKFKGIEEKYNDLVFSYEVYTYGVGDNVYVLDYGLPVELAGQNFGFQNNDMLTNNFNNYPVRITATVVNPTSNYGTFTHTSAVNAAGDTSISSLKYTPSEIIDNIDTVQVKIQIVETQTEEGVTTVKELDKYTGVEMTQLITTAPANVVYYEENFPGITYTSAAGTWVQYETKVPKKDANGNVLKDASGNVIYEELVGIEQSDNPNLNYGEDPSYEKDKEGVLVGNNGQIGTKEDQISSNLEFADLDKMKQETIDAINDYLGNRGGDSNGSVKELEIMTTGEVMHFTFTGTGVEIIGRTTDDAYAVINVIVQKKTGQDADGNDLYSVVRMKPVITESIGGDQYQVPIISITGLEKAEYRVVLKVMKSAQTTVQRMLYIDGVRIYGPLSDGEALEYYNPEEYKAVFYEVKQKIQDGDVIFCAASDTGNKFQVLTGNTMVENDKDGTVLTKTVSETEYLVVGPNNELYLNGVSTTAVIAFFMSETPDYIDGARTLQIGAHRKADANSLEKTSAVNMVYGSLEAKVTNAKAGDANFYSIDTGTEMYYDIDIKELSYDEKLGGWIVMIGTNGASKAGAKDTLALTNIKVAGYEISSVADALKNAENNNTSPTSIPVIGETLAVMKTWLAAANQEPETEDLPVNENLRIEEIVYVEETVASGKYALLTIKTTSDADEVVIYDAEGNKVELATCDRRRSKGAVYYDLAWIVNGDRGEKQTFTIRVFDSEKLASVNAETITVTIV